MTIKGVRKPKSKSPKQLDAEIKAVLGYGNGWGPVSTPDIPPFTGASVDVDGSTIKIAPAAVRTTRSPHDAWFARAVKRTNDDAWLVVSPRGHGCRLHDRRRPTLVDLPERRRLLVVGRPGEGTRVPMRCRR